MSIWHISEYISKLLYKIIHHRNQLRHYRNVINQFHNLFDAARIDIDFSENLSVPVKYEPQSMHWHQQQVTVHSGILFDNGNKSYHPYLSSDNKHDQKFVKIVMDEMISCISGTPECFIIESDNCSGQYKSAEHFHDLQQIAKRP